MFKVAMSDYFRIFSIKELNSLYFTETEKRTLQP